jgi:RNA polymerase sigma factor for flagellar operon FliA
MSTKTPAIEYDEAEALWMSHCEAPSEDTVGRLVAFYLPLARQTVSLMSVYCRPDFDRDDLIQHAMMGLWQCIVKFDPQRQIRFGSYAIPRIRGAVLDALRRHDPLSRHDRALLKTLQDCVEAFCNQHQAVPDEETLAEQADIDVERLHELTARAQPVLSLDGVGVFDDDGSGQSLGDRLIDADAPDPSVETVRNEQGAIFRKAYRRLPPRQQKILYLYYYEDLTLKEIGSILDLTEARICQLHATALLYLKALMNRVKA